MTMIQPYLFLLVSIGLDSPTIEPEVHPRTESTFEELLSGSLHSNLVVRAKRTHTVKSTVSPTEPSASHSSSTINPPPSRKVPSVSSPPLHQQGSTQQPSPVVDSSTNFVGSHLPDHAITVSPEDSFIIEGTREKRKILEAYQLKFGKGYPESIVTRKKGKNISVDCCVVQQQDCRQMPSPPPTIDMTTDQKHHPFSTTRMAPSLDKSYRVTDLSLYNILPTLIVKMRSSFTRSDITNLRIVNKDFFRMVPKVLRWSQVDFSALREPRLNYEMQSSICPSRIEMASAAMVHFGMDPGKLVRYLAGEYTGQNRNVNAILNAVRDHISPEDFYHMARILLQGCPAKLAFEESSASKLAMIKRGNQKNFLDNPDIVAKTLNKEDRYSHILPMDEDICLFSPYLRHTAQGIVLKLGKDPRAVWDGSTKHSPFDVVLNDITMIADEAFITFGKVKMHFYQDIYNMRITYADDELLLALADVKACFRYPRIHPDLTGAFGFLGGGLYFLATAMVFGSNTSATSWEPFRRAIEALSLVYANRPELVVKHKKYINMICWNLVTPTAPFTRATPCHLNQGVSTPHGHPARMYVDDALIVALGVEGMKLALAAMIEAIFTVMGAPETELRQCPLAMNKWQELIVSHKQTMLGLIINTRTLTVGIPDSYVAEVAELISTTWHPSRKSFTVAEAQVLTGKLARLAEGAYWVFHLLSHLYTSLAAALAENKRFLMNSSSEFQRLISNIKANNFSTPCQDQQKCISFAMKQAAKQIHHSDQKYFINRTMRREIDFFQEKLQPDSGIDWCTPLAHIIPRAPSATSFGDSCLEGAGGYCIPLGFWWHLPFPEEVKQRTLLYKSDNKDGQLISINVLEFVTVIINYIAATHVISTTNIIDDPYPVLLNITDNTSALNWTVNSCKTSPIGRLLSRFFCSWLINSPVGINSKWIATDENKIADDISRQKLDNTSASHPTFDYSKLPQMYPELKHCSFFQIAPEIISLIWDVVLTERWPPHETVQILKQKPLGRLTTSDGPPSTTLQTQRGTN